MKREILSQAYDNVVKELKGKAKKMKENFIIIRKNGNRCLVGPEGYKFNKAFPKLSMLRLSNNEEENHFLYNMETGEQVTSGGTELDAAIHYTGKDILVIVER